MKEVVEFGGICKPEKDEEVGTAAGGDEVTANTAAEGTDAATSGGGGGVDGGASFVNDDDEIEAVAATKVGAVGAAARGRPPHTVCRAPDPGRLPGPEDEGGTQEGGGGRGQGR